ncbi:hypothetical protein [Streptomyces longispororuber]|uniref:hypothetical protein n=1 Tax=Streptomyces longispororuber TaxID=68230 RepID=UPI0036FB2A04
MTTYHLTAPGAEFVGDLQQGSAEERVWRSRSIAPSDIAAVMGRSPYQPREDLLHRKATGASRPPLLRPEQPGLGWDKQDELAEVFAAEHPQYDVVRTGYWRSTQRPWQRCWPHRVLIPAGHDFASGPAPILATLTFRTTPEPLDAVGWGPGAIAAVPGHINDATQWLLDALGNEVSYVMAYSKHGDETRTYLIHRDDAHITTLREAAQAFLAEVDEERRKLDIQAHASMEATEPGFTDRWQKDITLGD